MRPALSLRGISKRYGQTQALSEAEFDVRHGEIHALMGGNGCGKSTLVQILAGVVAPDAGTICVGEEEFDARQNSPTNAQRLGLRFVHQHTSTFPDLTVAENLGLGHVFRTSNGRIAWRRQRGHAVDVMMKLGISIDPRTPLRELSPSLQMMVAIGRALQDEDDSVRRILVLDEPTAALPASEATMLLRHLEQSAAAGRAIILITHRLEEVLRAAHRGTVLRDGRTVATLEREQLDHERLVQLIAGQAIEKDVDRKRRDYSNARPLLEAEGLCWGDAGLKLHEGEILGVAGLLGSGRTTLLRSLFGAAGTAERAISLDGVPARLSDTRSAVRAGFGYVAEHRSQGSFPNLSVARNVAIADLVDGHIMKRVSARDERAEAKRLVDRFLIRTASEESQMMSLSGGNQQKVILARWLKRDPRVLLLDEPTQGVDVGARAEIHRLIRIGAEQGTAVVVVSSDFGELAELCDRVITINAGKITADLTGDEVNEDALNRAAYALMPSAAAKGS